MQETIASPPMDTQPVVRARRRWPRRVAVALVLLLMGSAAYAGWFLSNYDPICHGPCTGRGGVLGPNVQSLGSFTSPQGDSFSAYRVPHRPGGQFMFIFSLSNDGLIPITVTGIDGGGTDLSPLPFTRVEVAPDVGDPYRARKPFHSFGLGRHTFMDVFVTVRMRGCLQEGTSMTLMAARIRFRVAGIPRTTWISLPETIEVSGTTPSCR